MKTLIALLTLITLPALAEIETQEFDAADVQNFELDNSTGDTDVKKSQNGKVKIIAEKKKYDDGCTMEMKKNASKISVKVQQPFRKTCEVDFQIFLPDNVNMNLQSGSGDFEIDGTKGNIVYRVGSGDVKIRADAKQIDGRSGTGELEAKGELGDVKVLTGSGNTKLIYTYAPNIGEIDIKSASGSAEITFPKTAKIISDSTIAAGKFYNEFGDTKDARFKVLFKAASGNLKILKGTN